MNDTERETSRKLWIVACRDELVRELEVEFAAVTTVAELADALAAELVPVVESGWVLTSDRLGRELDPSDRVLDSGLVSGDLIDLRTEARSDIAPGPEDGAVDLVVIGGPLLGTRFRLDRGNHVIGRGSGSDVTIDDPSMSRRHLEVVIGGDAVTVSDVGSTNGTFVDGEKLTGARRLALGEVIEAGGSLISFEPALALNASSTSDGIEIPFNRPPRVKPAQRTIEVDAPEPPDEPTRPRMPLAVSIVPLLIGIALVFLFPDNKVMLLFFAMTPVIAVWSFIEERRSGSKVFRMRKTEYQADVSSLEEHLARSNEEEAYSRRDSYPDAAELTERVRGLSSRLWERRPADPDFLSVRVGWGDEPSLVTVTLPSSGSRQLRDETAERLARFATLKAVPIVVGLRDAQVTGLCGDPDDVAALARWIVVQLATLHSPDELEMAAILPADAGPGWSWAKWLPHFGSLARRGRVAFEHEALSLIERLAPATDTRSRRARAHTLVVVHGDAEVPRSALGRLLRAAGDDMSVLWLGRDPTDLPGPCRAVVEIDSGSDVVSVLLPERGERSDHHGPEGISLDHAAAIARALAPVRDTGLGPGERSVPTRVGLWESLGLSEPSMASIRDRWRRAGPERTFRLGATGGPPLIVDLRRDGPHGLIGGTTGAGKSELLRSMVASIATEYSPELINLFLIDYKGGTAFEGVTSLPHVVGCVTDLDRHLARRTLVALEAELKRREIVLREHGARDVVELGTGGDHALPDLLIVVDEFAALVTDLPQFVDGMVDIAQRGRALGLHLILATQKPAGVVSEKIRANTNIRIALRMSDEADSMDVIGIPDSAHIPRSIPGRGFLRLGHGEVTEFQSPYASAPALTARSEGVVVRRLGPAGTIVDETGEEEAASTSQLDELVRAIAEAGTGLSEPSSPVPPPLPDVLPLSTLGQPPRPGAFPVGIADDPSLQRQQIYELDFENDGSVLVYGTGGSGKTTLLRTIAASIATHSTSDRSQIYALDLGTRGLASLAALPHCGSVIFADEEDRIRRLFGMLRDEIAARRIRDGRHDAPTIVVLLDGYSGFAAAFERQDFGEMVDALPRLVADGRQVGIHFVITADRRGAVPAALSGIISTRIVLRLADDDEYAAFGLAGTEREALATRGRAFVGAGVVVQCAVTGAGAAASDQIEAIQSLAGSMDTQPPAPPIRVLPSSVPVGSLPAPSTTWTIPIGLDERYETAVCDVGHGHWLVAGPRRSGRSTTLSAVALQAARGPTSPSLHLLAPRDTAIDAAVTWTSTAIGTDACDGWIRSANGTLAEPSLVFIDDGDELFDALSADALQATLKWARDHDVRFVVAVESHAAHRAFGGWFAELKKEKRGLLLDPDLDVDGDLLGARLPRRKMSFPAGRGYLIDRGEARLIQVARPTRPGSAEGEGPEPRL